MGHLSECRRSWRSVWAGLGALVLAGCGPLALPTAPEPATTTTIPTTIATTPSATAKPVVEPTATAPAPSPTPTDLDWVTSICHSPDAISLAPAGDWAAVDCHEARARFTVLGREGPRWVIGDEPLAASFTLTRRALFWSADGRYLFFDREVVRADTDPTGFAQVGSVERLTLATGDRVPILISVNDVAAYSVAFDPNGAWLAWLLADAPQRITVVDLSTYAMHKIDLSLSLAAGGDLTWSPQGDRLALAGVQADGRGAVVMIEPGTGTTVALPTPDDRVLRLVAWPVGDLIELHDQSWPAPGAWRLNLTTGDFLRQIAEEPP